MYAYQGDVLWGNGRDGGYLVLGNIVYTVSHGARTNLRLSKPSFNFTVRRCDSLFEGGSYYKFMDVADPLFNMGFNWFMVRFYYYL